MPKGDSQIYGLAEGGEVIERRIRTEPERFDAVLGTRPRGRIVIEAGAVPRSAAMKMVDHKSRRWCSARHLPCPRRSPVALGELRQTIRINDDGTGRVDLANSTWATSGCPLRGARAHGATPTLAVFAQALGTVPFDPAQHRIFIRFVDGQGITRGATSAAVRTE